MHISFLLDCFQHGLCDVLIEPGGKQAISHLTTLLVKYSNSI